MGKLETNLEKRLRKLEEKHGKGNPDLQWLRDQIASEKRGQSFRDQYIEGMTNVTPDSKLD